MKTIHDVVTVTHSLQLEADSKRVMIGETGRRTDRGEEGGEVVREGEIGGSER